MNNQLTINLPERIGIVIIIKPIDLNSISLDKLKSESGFYHTIKNTDYILDNIPDILFSKTGFTPLAGGNLVIIYKNEYGHEMAITVLGSTMDGRFTDVEKIVSTLYNINYGK